MDVKLPNLGEGADSGTVVSILVKPGAQIKKGQNIIELETGKAVAPIPSSAAGTVKEIRVKEGEKISIGQVILSLDEAAAPAAPNGTAPPAKSARREAGAEAPRSAAPAPAAEESGAAPETTSDEVVNENPVASPSLRRAARELAIDLRRIRGTGSGGRIEWEDVRNYIARLQQVAEKRAQPGAAPAPPPVDFSQWGQISKRPMSPLRKIIAQRMSESRRVIPEVTQFDEADVTDLERLRKQFAPAYEEKGTKLTLTAFAIKAAIVALQKYPVMNSSLDDAAAEVIYKEYFHLGLAVDTEAGLVVPVIRDADRKSLLELSKEIQELGAKARDRKLSLEEMRGGTFTISNQGGIGSGPFTPVINHPEVAILGLGRGVLKPAVREGKIEPRLLLPLTVAYDHRVIDGGTAARFTVELVNALQSFKEQDVKI